MEKDYTQSKAVVREGRLELLLFFLEGGQPFGINVLKVKEIFPSPRLNEMPMSHPSVIGVTELRGSTIPVIDLALALGRSPIQDRSTASVIVTEFNRSFQGFLVAGVDRIIEKEWKNVTSPPKGSGRHVYISGVTEFSDRMIQILDLERILYEVLPPKDFEAEFTIDDAVGLEAKGAKVLVADDSAIARGQTVKTLDRIGATYAVARDGREALTYLKGLVEKGVNVKEEVSMVISDIEMPEVDGYTLCKEIRRDPALAELYVLLHTSLNGSISHEQAEKAGADAILTKFVPSELAKAVIAGL